MHVHSHADTPEFLRDDAINRRDAHRALGFSALGLAFAGGVELLLAVVTGSVALLSDALHNLADVSTSAVVFIGLRISRRPASPRYPYGYERAEDLAGLGVALVIWSSALFAGYESFRKLVDGTGTSHIGVGMAGACLGIIGNQVVARYKMIVGKRINSVTLQADARHSWLDALSSLGALIGLGIVATGHSWGDPVAGLVVMVFILHVGWEVTGQVLHHLMDGVDDAHMHAALDAVAGVSGVHDPSIRGRWMGRSLLLDVDAVVDGAMSVDEADHLGDHVAERIREALPSVRTVTFTPLSHRDG